MIGLDAKDACYDINVYQDSMCYLITQPTKNLKEPILLKSTELLNLQKKKKIACSVLPKVETKAKMSQNGNFEKTKIFDSPQRKLT